MNSFHDPLSRKQRRAEIVKDIKGFVDDEAFSVQMAEGIVDALNARLYVVDAYYRGVFYTVPRLPRPFELADLVVNAQEVAAAYGETVTKVRTRTFKEGRTILNEFVITFGSEVQITVRFRTGLKFHSMGGTSPTWSGF